MRRKRSACCGKYRGRIGHVWTKCCWQRWREVLGSWLGRDAVLVELEGHGREDVLPDVS